MKGCITDVAGIRVGHAQNYTGKTGCTVILPPAKGTMGGICLRGAAPASRELDLLRIDGVAREVHAVLLTGGSAFGLGAADGVLQWLEEQNVGFNAGVATVPLVPTISLFDLAHGLPDIRPDAAMGMLACKNASSSPTHQGAIGAGTGATVGKLFGMEQSMQSGVGTASTKAKDITVGALAVSNAFGDLKDERGNIVAGARKENSHDFKDTCAYLTEHGLPGGDPFANCTFAVVAMDAKLDRRQANRIAEMAMTGLERTIFPAHSMFDFDAVIVLGCGDGEGDLHSIGSAAADVVQKALLNGVLAANG